MPGDESLFGVIHFRGGDQSFHFGLIQSEVSVRPQLEKSRKHVDRRAWDLGKDISLTP